MLSLGEQKGSGSLNIFDKYLADPSLPIENGLVQDMLDYPLASNEAYSDRFGQLLNSYFACLNGISTITGGINNDTSYFWDTNITFVPPKLADGPNSQGRWMNYNWTGDNNRRSRVWPSEGTKHVHVEVRELTCELYTKHILTSYSHYLGHHSQHTLDHHPLHNLPPPHRLQPRLPSRPLLPDQRPRCRHELLQPRHAQQRLRVSAQQRNISGCGTSV